MDGMPSYPAHPATAGPLRTTTGPLSINPAAIKTPSNYLRALRRRVWMVLAIAVPVASLASIYVLRMPPIYLVRTEIEINAPDYDPALSALVSHDVGRNDAGSQERYIPAKAAKLKSNGLHEKVIRHPSIAPQVTQYEDPATELFRSLNIIPNYKNGNTFIVTLEGNDAARTKKLLEVLLSEFESETKDENEAKIQDTKLYAKQNVAQLENELKELDKRIEESLTSSQSTIGAGGRSIIEEEYLNLGTKMNQMQVRMGELGQQMMLAEMFPKMDPTGESSARASRLAQLEMQRRMGVRVLRNLKRTVRDFEHDPAAAYYAEILSDVLDEIDELRKIGKRSVANPTETILEQYNKELEADKEAHRDLLKKMQETLPIHQRVLTMMEERREKSHQLGAMNERVAGYDILSRSLTQKSFVKRLTAVNEPNVPIKPNRALLIGMALFVSFGMGIGLVCLLEHIDHAVKVPEHVSHGLSLPLLGVVPRIRRTALTQRGRHLWTPGASGSVASDAYRNVRASLLGVSDRRGPIVTLLVTSAKAGEGKSTTALNLAATCALAGERTLLLDIDLRRPTLAEVFIEDEEDRHDAPGAVDVLRGEIPWQRTLRHTRIPNLDFIPTGDTRETPIEILGTLELRQLLLALSHHYDRVILDGPAVLGLADCRFLGRIVDASLLVVRSGSHHLMTLHRAKAMLEQSHVAIAGVVVNGLTEDLANWSSYGYGDALPAPGRFEHPARVEDALALAGRG
jgi:capsular exopolysaccharide synthesis family protein